MKLSVLDNLTTQDDPYLSPRYVPLEDAYIRPFYNWERDRIGHLRQIGANRATRGALNLREDRPRVSEH